MSVANILLSLLPVATLLVMLIILDSFKLIKIKLVLLGILWGAICVGVAYFINRWLIFSDAMEIPDFMNWLIPPFFEEILKITFVIILIKYNRIGFMIDGAIYGFAIGTGFALMENIYYLSSINSDGIMLWIVRGFGTAIMHGGTVAIFSVIMTKNINIYRRLAFTTIPAYLFAVMIHYLFNLISHSAYIATLLTIFIIPAILLTIINLNEKSIRKWIDIEMDQEVELLLMIRQGKFTASNAGKFIISLKKHFQPLVIADIISYIYLYLELSVKAKANLILKENNMPARKIPDIDPQLKELQYLKRSIGRTGMIAIRPILRMNNKDLWKLTTLK